VKIRLLQTVAEERYRLKGRMRVAARACEQRERSGPVERHRHGGLQPSPPSSGWMSLGPRTVVPPAGPALHKSLEKPKRHLQRDAIVFSLIAVFVFVLWLRGFFPL